MVQHVELQEDHIFLASLFIQHFKFARVSVSYIGTYFCRLLLKCDGTRAETRFRLLAKRTSPFKSAGASVQSITGSRGVRISGSNAGYIMFRGSVKGTGYPLHSPVSPSLPFPCVTVCHHVSTRLYKPHTMFLLVGCVHKTFRSRYSVALSSAVYCLRVNVYCTAATGFQPNCSSQIYQNCEKRLLASPCPSVCPYATTALLLDGFS